MGYQFSLQSPEYENTAASPSQFATFTMGRQAFIQLVELIAPDAYEVTANLGIEGLRNTRARPSSSS